MEWLSDPQTWVALATLTALEIVLGIDNVIFIAILAGKLPPQQQPSARTLGLGMALITRLLLLLSLTWIMQLTQPLFTVLSQEISGRDLILLIGGLFLIAKSTLEIHESLEGAEAQDRRRAVASFAGVVLQIMFLDIIFSLDSVITAIGLVSQLAIMIVAVIIAVIFMMLFSGAISGFVERHPTIKMLALSFLLLVGLALMGESFDLHIPKGYIYFAMAFSVFVEMLNLKMRRRSADPVQLRHPHSPGEDPPP
ncbi:MAG: TerC family protein [Candidatus Latescibacteria bacterium]|nr:TerC family protein [Candidatus Latescibacterota bacterium]